MFEAPNADETAGAADAKAKGDEPAAEGVVAVPNAEAAEGVAAAGGVAAAAPNAGAVLPKRLPAPEAGLLPKAEGAEEAAGAAPNAEETAGAAAEAAGVLVESRAPENCDLAACI